MQKERKSWRCSTQVAESAPQGQETVRFYLLPLQGGWTAEVKSFTQGGGEHALPWARYQALTGRMFDKTRYFDATLSKSFAFLLFGITRLCEQVEKKRAAI